MHISQPITNNHNGNQRTKNKGVVSGLVAKKIAFYPCGVLVGQIAKKNLIKSFVNDSDAKILDNAAQEGLKISGLANKGVKIYSAQETHPISAFHKMYIGIKSKLQKKEITIQSAAENIKNSFIELLNIQDAEKPAVAAIQKELEHDKVISLLSKNKSLKKSGINLTDFLAKVKYMKYKEGLNAAFFPNANSIITPSKTLKLSVFHEMGHAMNANGNIVSKLISKSVGVSKIAPAAILAISLLNKRKADDNNNNVKTSKLQKTKDFVKKNAGLLTGISMLPLLVEEASASLKGQNIAKKLVKNNILPKSLYNRSLKSNALGFLTYALYSVFSIIAVKSAIKVKDSVQGKYENKRK